MRFLATRVLGAAALVLVALALGQCGGGGKGDAPTVPAVPTAPPVAGPTPEPPLSASCERLPLGVVNADATNQTKTRRVAAGHQPHQEKNDDGNNNDYEYRHNKAA